MSLVEHAKKELELAGLFDESGDFYGGMVGKAVMELMEVFAKQGHSGSSAPMVASLFSKLACYEALNPITGADDEWINVGIKEDEIHYQNARCSGLFKHNDGRITYNSAIIKRCENGTCWSGPLYLTREDAIEGKNMIRSSLEIKEFPFTPKTFYIDVLEEEIEKDDWIMWCKDITQMEQVWEYYKKP